MRRLAFFAVLFAVVGCGPAPSTTPSAAPVAIAPPVKATIPSPPRAAPAVKASSPAPADYQFGEQVSDGFLRVTVTEAAGDQVTGLRNGSFAASEMTLVRISIKNTSPGKIADWPGWQGQGEIEDEFGNKFKPADLSGWWGLPHGGDNANGGDFATRIFPGTTYENCAYYEYAPPTSKRAVIALPLGSRVVRFHGNFGAKEKLDNDAALKAKEGMVLDAGDLLKDLIAGSRTVRADYPIGCMMRATGPVGGKNGGPLIFLEYPNAGATAWVSPSMPTGVTITVTDKGFFDSIKPGDIVSVQGSLFSIGPERGARLIDCAKAKTP